MKASKNIKRKYVKLIQRLLRNYMPRELILGIDVGICLISALITYLLIFNITSSLTFFPIPWKLWILVLVQAFYIIIFKSYVGIIRYSSLKDAAKQFQVVVFCIITLLIINQIYWLTAGNKLLLNSGLLVYGILTFSLLFLFRIIVKAIYEAVTRECYQTRALILGFTPEDVAMASGLVDQNGSDFTIVGFLDDQEKTMKNLFLGFLSII